MKTKMIGLQIVFTLVGIFLLQIGGKAYADNPDLMCTATNEFHFYFVDKYTAQFSNIPDRVTKGNMLCYNLWSTCTPGSVCPPAFICQTNFDSKYGPRYTVRFEPLKEKPGITGIVYQQLNLGKPGPVSKITCEPRKIEESEPLSEEEEAAARQKQEEEDLLNAAFEEQENAQKADAEQQEEAPPVEPTTTVGTGHANPNQAELPPCDAVKITDENNVFAYLFKLISFSDAIASKIITEKPLNVSDSNLKCETLIPDCRHKGPCYPILSCSDGVSDGGFSAKLTINSNTGTLNGVLYEKHLNYPKEYEINCRYKAKEPCYCILPGVESNPDDPKGDYPWIAYDECVKQNTCEVGFAP